MKLLVFFGSILCSSVVGFSQEVNNLISQPVEVINKPKPLVEEKISDSIPVISSSIEAPIKNVSNKKGAHKEGSKKEIHVLSNALKPEE